MLSIDSDIFLMCPDFRGYSFQLTSEVETSKCLLLYLESIVRMVGICI